MQRAVTNRLARAEQALKENETALRWFSPRRHLARLVERSAGLASGLERAAAYWLDAKKQTWERLEQSRRSSFNAENLAMRNARLDVLTSALPATLLRRIMDADHRLALAHTRLHATIRELLTDRERVLENLDLALEVGNPLAPLRRGYALVRTRQGNILRSVDEALPASI